MLEPDALRQGTHTRWPLNLKVGTYVKDTFEMVLKRFSHILRVADEEEEGVPDEAGMLGRGTSGYGDAPHGDRKSS